MPATRTPPRGTGAEALADCDSCLALDADLAEARWNRALALEMVGRRDDAAAEIRAKVEELRGKQ